MLDKKLQNRLSRVEGQLKKLQLNLLEDSDCAEVIPQFLAVKGAISAAFNEYIKLSLNNCSSSDKEKMKEIISLLVKS